MIDHVLSAYTAAVNFGVAFESVAASAQLLLYRKCLLDGHLDGKLRRDVCRW
jgi:hypothetical protein